MFCVSIAPQSIQRLKYDAGTFCNIQYAVYDDTEHPPDVVHDFICGVISKTKDISANYHRVHEANIHGSWEE